jgi:hypothetical protein
MNSESPNPMINPQADAESTLRLIAQLPAPQGLEDRIRITLADAYRRKPGRLFFWPVSGAAGNAWLRSAAAAAIALVIVGGGWSISVRMQPWQRRHISVAPSQISAPGGFSGAGAIRTPQTLNGPVLAHPVKTQDEQSKRSKKEGTKKSAPVKPVPQLQ